MLLTGIITCVVCWFDLKLQAVDMEPGSERDVEVGVQVMKFGLEKREG